MSRNLPPELVIEKIAPFLTEERKAKIERVVSQRLFDKAVLLENIYDRGNISAVMRSAEALGIYQIHILNTQDEFKVSGRVSQGAENWLEIYDWTSRSDCLGHLKETPLAVSRLGAKQKLEELPLDRPLVLAFGNEKEGVSEELSEAADFEFEIPMYGFTQSFNISVAAALCFQKIRDSAKPSLVAERMKELKALYYWRSYEHSEKLFRSQDLSFEC